MGADILTFEKGQEDFQLKGLKIYIALTLPLSFVTLFAWYIIDFLAGKANRSALAPGRENAYSTKV
jgi:hypothetical protein